MRALIMPRRAWVHGGNQLKFCRKLNLGIGARNDDFTTF